MALACHSLPVANVPKCVYFKATVSVVSISVAVRIPVEMMFSDVAVAV